jgi:phosphomannomutase
MAGGFGTRLGPLTTGLPNPLVPIGNLTFPKLQPAFDGMAAAVRILAMTARLDMRLHQPAHAVSESHVRRGEVLCPDERKGAVMRRIIEATQGEVVGLEVVGLIERVRVPRDEERVAAILDADHPCFRMVVESTDGEWARLPVEEFPDRTAAWRKEAA